MGGMMRSEGSLGVLACCMCCGCILPWIFLAVGVGKTAEHASLTAETCEKQDTTTSSCTYTRQDCSQSSGWNDDDDDHCVTRSYSGSQYIYKVDSEKCGAITESGSCGATPGGSGSGVYAKTGSFKCFIPDCSYNNAYLTEDEVISTAKIFFALTAVFLVPWLCIVAFLCFACARPGQQSNSMQKCLWRLGCNRSYTPKHLKNKNKAPNHGNQAFTTTTVVTQGAPAAMHAQPMVVQAQPVMHAQPMMGNPVQYAQPMAQPYAQPMQQPMQGGFAPAPGPMMAAPAPGPMMAQPMMGQPMMGQPMQGYAPAPAPIGAAPAYEPGPVPKY